MGVSGGDQHREMAEPEEIECNRNGGVYVKQVMSYKCVYLNK